jgi:hypothetical protein
VRDTGRIFPLDNFPFAKVESALINAGKLRKRALDFGDRSFLIRVRGLQKEKLELQKSRLVCVADLISLLRAVESESGMRFNEAVEQLTPALARIAMAADGALPKIFGETGAGRLCRGIHTCFI